MNKLTLVIVAGAVILAGIIGYVVFHQGNTFGATINYSNCGSQANCYNMLSGLLTDITNIRQVVSGLVTSSTASLQFPTGTATTTTATTTQVIGLAAAAGDIVLVSPVTQTLGIIYSASVAVASTTSATFQITAANASTTAVAPTASVFNLTVLPRASFLAPAALTTVTSTSN